MKRAILIFLAVYGLVSVVTFIVYAIDKSAARNDRRRIPEKTLHLLALCGGWPGALFAQKLLRHKTQKQPFLTVFWCIVVIHVIALISLLWLL